MCGAPMDRYGDHTETCTCGGDREVRDTAVRNGTHCKLCTGWVPSEKEKAGLSPGRPDADAAPTCAQARRPADILVTSTRSSQPIAVDFAVTSGLQQGQITADDEEMSGVFASYEDYKFTYKDTGQQCAAQGITFFPFVIEAHGGGISPKGRRLLGDLAKESAASQHLEPAQVALRMAQRISCSLQRESARAILRRLHCEPIPVTDGGWDAVPMEDREQGQ